MEISYTFPSAKAAAECMDAIDKIANWNVARQFGCYSSTLSIIAEYLAKEPKEVQASVRAIIAMYGGKLN
ncbi:hypothetical protein [uncultured Treponema sp.]|uniref:hypothetical protein n=1 Tax=uncultured Treponema sp. TaxID=162155 RepID=UPI00261AE28F|nr:hypothetical protein [uncultured Treponema sp.]